MCGISWVVGWLEGEGGFIARKHRHAQWEVALQGTSTDEDVILKVQRVLGGKTYGPYTRRNPRHKPTFRWCLYSRAGLIKLLPRLRRHFGQRRRQQVDRMLAVLHRPKWKRGWSPSAE